jgi:putative hemolysin
MIFKHSKSAVLLLVVLGVTTGCEKQKKVGLTNPASQNCVAKGGKVVMAKQGDGGEYGICLFEDSRQCEEWALLRGECPVGGLKVTGYQTPGAVYCTLKGGKVLDNETQCQLPSGKSCSTQDLYMGKCS